MREYHYSSRNTQVAKGVHYFRIEASNVIPTFAHSSKMSTHTPYTPSSTARRSIRTLPTLLLAAPDCGTGTNRGSPMMTSFYVCCWSRLARVQQISLTCWCPAEYHDGKAAVPFSWMLYLFYHLPIPVAAPWLHLLAHIANKQQSA